MINFLKKLRNNFEKRARRIDKRYRMGFSVLILGTLMFISTFFYFDKAILFVPLFAVLTYFLTYFSLLEEIEKIGWIGLFIMPELISVFFYIFYFLFPGRWLTRVPFVVVYMVSVYAVLLCSNIFNVGVEKNLQLYRAAFSINFFYQTFISFVIFNLLFSLKNYFFLNVIVIGVVGYLLSLHLFWTIRLKMFLEKEIKLYAIFVGLALAELGFVLSFIPLKTTVYALFLSSSYYSLTGIIHNYIEEKLFKETIREFIIVWLVVLVITLLSISW